MEIKFNPPPSEKGSGITAFISFTQPEFKAAIENIICKRDSETIGSIEIDRDGITVRLLTPNAKLTRAQEGAEQNRDASGRRVE